MHFTARLVCCLFLAISLSGCSKFSLPKIPGIYKFDIQQGNLITQDMIDQLKPGMTKPQVRFIMGTPLIADTFSQDRWDYFYSLQPGDRSGEVRERMAIFFKDDVLVGFRGDFVPGQNAPKNPDSSDSEDLETEDSELGSPETESLEAENTSDESETS
jgi:outer membrane protein assembly factor BamE